MCGTAFKLRSIFLQHLASSSQNSLNTFQRIYQATNGFTICSSYLPHHPLLTKEKRLHWPYLG